MEPIKSLVRPNRVDEVNDVAEHLGISGITVTEAPRQTKNATASMSACTEKRPT